MTDQYTIRTSGTQLPSSVELLDILTKESQRKAIRFDFIKTHNSVFDVHRQLSNLADSNDSWIDSYTELRLDQIIVQISKNHAELSHFIRQNSGNADTYRNLYAALVPKDDPTKSDAIFVFGASSNARIERAVELYKSGVSGKIIISGNSPHYIEGVQSEAKRMAMFAIERGIPSDALIVEESSITLPDNVKRTIDLLESMDWRPSLLTIVATNFVLTRAVMEWYKFCPWDIEIKPVAARSQSSRFTNDGWTSDDECIALVLNEYAKLVLESKIDLMRRDGDIQ